MHSPRRLIRQCARSNAQSQPAKSPTVILWRNGAYPQFLSRSDLVATLDRSDLPIHHQHTGQTRSQRSLRDCDSQWGVGLHIECCALTGTDTCSLASPPHASGLLIRSPPITRVPRGKGSLTTYVVICHLPFQLDPLRGFLSSITDYRAPPSVELASHVSSNHGHPQPVNAGARPGGNRTGTTCGCRHGRCRERKAGLHVWAQ